MKRLVLLFFISNFSILASSQTSGQPHFAQQSKCYEKCLVPDEIEYEIAEQFAVFDGLDATGIELDTVIIFRDSVNWVKKFRTDPEIGLVGMWCIEKMKPRIDTLVVVRDTSQTDDFYWQTKWRRKIIEMGGYQDSYEVLCKEKMTPRFFKRLSEKLRESGIEIEFGTESFTPELQEKLTQFQKDNSLPVGHLNLKTLEKLGLAF